ncbi:hypothetical protein ABPG75_001857 [Micractinium tetrahymenae]
MARQTSGSRASLHDRPCPPPPPVTATTLALLGFPGATGRLGDLVRAAEMAAAQADPEGSRAIALQQGALAWLRAATAECNSEVDAALAHEPAVIRVLQRSMAQQRQPQMRHEALWVIDALAVAKVNRSQLYQFIPLAAQLAADPSAAAAEPGWRSAESYSGMPRLALDELERSLQSIALSALCLLLDSHDARGAARAAAPRLVDVTKGLLAAGPEAGAGSAYDRHERYERAFAVLASYIQDLELGAEMAALLADDAVRLLKRDAGRGPGLEPGKGISVYRTFKCLTNMSARPLGGTGQVQKLLAAGVPERCRQLMKTPHLRNETRQVLFNFSGSAPEAYLQAHTAGAAGAGGAAVLHLVAAAATAAAAAAAPRQRRRRQRTPCGSSCEHLTRLRRAFVWRMWCLPSARSSIW